MICADATAPYEGLVNLFVRRILFLDQRYYVILDELKSMEPSTFEWLLHFDGELKRTDRGFLVSQNEARLLVEFVKPSVFNYRLEKGYRPMHEDFTRVQTAEEKHTLLTRKASGPIGCGGDSVGEVVCFGKESGTYLKFNGNEIHHRGKG
ncbi:MAG TPA: hypothetical protein EYP53_06270 [Candidatus Latescibacteria bacterium]|nr:hypothetical protein [Candidatus Latescibacterota bacterium]